MKLRLIAWFLTVAAVIVTWNYRHFFPLPTDPMVDNSEPTPDSITYSLLPDYPAPPNAVDWRGMDGKSRLKSARDRVLPKLNSQLAEHSLTIGSPVYLRVFKETLELELWLQNASTKEWMLFRNHKIAGMSGQLGPKTKEGDLQAPEGFYGVTRSLLNPLSSYHLSFNIGYPNAFDRYHKRTGSAIMVHGKDISIGCFAMTDKAVEEIYLLVESALTTGNQKEVPVHVFPFRMDDIRMEESTQHPSYSFWDQLRDGYNLFESTGQPPKILVRDGHYQAKAAPSS